MSQRQQVARADNSLHISKVVVDKFIRCRHCRKDSGFTNADIIPLRGNFTLKCKNCGEICLRHIDEVKSTIYDFPETEKRRLKDASDNYMSEDEDGPKVKLKKDGSPRKTQKKLKD